MSSRDRRIRPQATRKPCLNSHNRVHSRKLVSVEGGDCSKRSNSFFRLSRNLTNPVRLPREPMAMGLWMSFSAQGTASCLCCADWTEHASEIDWANRLESGFAAFSPMLRESCAQLFSLLQAPIRLHNLLEDRDMGEWRDFGRLTDGRTVMS